MLEKILAVTGKPGLFKLISGSQKMIIVESLLDGKRMPAYAHERVIALSDIAMYTEDEEIPLRQVFEAVQKKEGGKAVGLDVKKASDDELHAYMAAVLPAYDRERVHTSDIKKLISWYNLLTKNELTDFSDPQEQKEQKEA